MNLKKTLAALTVAGILAFVSQFIYARVNSES